MTVPSRGVWGQEGEPEAMAKSKNFGTKRIAAGSARAKEITRFIDERRGRSAVTGRHVTAAHGRRTGDPRKKAR